MKKKQEAFETLPQMAERIKRQRLEALEKQFPPPWIRPGWRRVPLISLPLVLMAIVEILIIFLTGAAERPFEDGITVFGVRVCALVLIYIIPAHASLAIAEWLEQCREKAHPNHPFGEQKARDDAIAEASDPRLLRLAAINEFLDRLTRTDEGLAVSYRDGPDDPERVEAIGEMRTLQEFLTDPSCYRGMNHLNAPVNVRIDVDPPETDEAKADAWFDDILARHQKALAR